MKSKITLTVVVVVSTAMIMGPRLNGERAHLRLFPDCDQIPFSKPSLRQ